MSRERLSAESAALRMGRSTHSCSADVPTSAITDVAAASTKMLLIDHDQAVPKMVEKYGPPTPTLIPKGSLSKPGRQQGRRHLEHLAARRLPEDLAYNLTKIMLEKRETRSPESAQHQGRASRMPASPGAAALKYFAEKGIKVD
jgi:hypothetical protein